MKLGNALGEQMVTKLAKVVKLYPCRKKIMETFYEKLYDFLDMRKVKLALTHLKS